MAIDTQALELKLVRTTDHQEVDITSLQGLWTEQQYLKITNQTNNRIEFTDGVLEMLPMPTNKHQAILEILFVTFRAWMSRTGGKARIAPIDLRVRQGKFRQPDMILLRDSKDPRLQNAAWLGADLALEVVSPDDPERDTVVKRREYAEAGIPEYWIVNPLDATITVLTLDGPAYAEHGVFRRGEMATSVLLAGFAVSVAEVFDAD